MSVTDWIGIAFFAPLMIAMAILLGYIIVGILGSNARRRRVAEARSKAQSQPAEDATPARSRRKAHES